MTVTLYGNSPYQVLSLGSIFDSMANTGLVLSGVLSVPLLTGSSEYPVYGELVLEGTGLVTTGSGSPNFQAVLIPETPGSTYQEDIVASSQLFPISGLGQEPLPPSSAITVIRLQLGQIWPIANQKLAAYSLAGNALAASVTANLRFWGCGAG